MDNYFSGIAAFFAIFGVFLIVIFGVAIALYIVCSIKNMHVLESLGYEYPIAAWIPFWNNWALADAAYAGEDQAQLIILNAKCPVIVLKLQSVIIFVASLVLSVVPILGQLAWIISLLARIVLFGTVYQELGNEMEHPVSVGKAVIGGWIPIVEAFDLGAVAKKRLAGEE